jgi:hypothetical protein
VEAKETATSKQRRRDSSIGVDKMETMQIASFIVRFQLTEFNEEPIEKRWRIKVTHVQEDYENLFDSIEEAMLYMKEKVLDC